MGPYAGVDSNLTFCRFQHIYHGQAYAKTDLHPPVGDFGFGLSVTQMHCTYRTATKQPSSHQQAVQFMFQFTCVSVQAHV